MKVLAFAASNSTRSINGALIAYAIQRLEALSDGVLTETLDLNDYELPIYSIDHETTSGIPAAAETFFEKIGEADAVLVSFAEHNGETTVAWKNLFDWMSRIEMKVWQGTPLLMLAATPGKRGGESVLSRQAQLSPHFGADIKGQLGIGRWQDAWDSNRKTLTNARDVQRLDELLLQLLGLKSLNPTSATRP